MPVRTVVDEAVLTITMDRPDALNAIDPGSHEELVAAWTRLRDEDGLRVAVLTGSGSKSFSAGIDLKRLSDFYAESYPGERRQRWSKTPGIGGLTRNFDPGKPVIAAINGYCLGLGLELALACDIRLASPNAVFGLPEVRWGIIPGQGGTQRLPRAIAPNVALEMILAGERLTAPRAYDLGLINHVIPLRRLRGGALALARRIADLPPRAVRNAREAVRRGLDHSLEDGLKLEQDLAEPLRSSRDNRVALASFDRARGRRRG
ncbi:MAG: enoyl-CoA hydratase/isomerase family protein [Thermoplasmata archaeon]